MCRELIFKLSNKTIAIALTSIQIFFFVLIIFDLLDLNNIFLKCFRLVAGVICLLFIPGFVILNIFKIDIENYIVKILFSIGLSIFLLIIFGIMINFTTFVPFFCISRPLSEKFVIPFYFLFILFLYVLFYLKTKNTKIIYNFSFSISLLFFILLFFISIIGVFVDEYYHINIILLGFLVLVSIVPFIFTYTDKYENMYPVVIWFISISILFHTSLVSPYIWGADSFYDMYNVKLVLHNGVWNPTFSNDHNAMLSLVILAPVLIYLLKTNTTWLFKTVYPFIFSFVPVGLYEIFKKQVGNKLAFFSTYFFMSVSVYYTELLSLAKQEIAEFFFVLVIYLLFVDDLKDSNKIFLLIIFSVLLSVTHYGTSGWFVVILVLFCLVGLFLRIVNISGYLDDIFIYFTILYFAITLLWYMYISGGSVFRSIAQSGFSIVRDTIGLFRYNIATHMLNRTEHLEFARRIAVYLNLVAQVFISFGLIAVLIGRYRSRFKKSFILMSAISYVFFVTALKFRYFSLGITRLYHLSLFFLSPFFVVGFTYFSELVLKFLKFKLTKDLFKSSVKILSIFLCIFLLFNSGVVAELSGCKLSSVALSYSHNISGSNIIDKIKYYNWYTNGFEILSSEWIGSKRCKLFKIYVDKVRYRRLRGYGVLPEDDMVILKNKVNVCGVAYIYLGTLNVKERIIEYHSPDRGNIQWWPLNEILNIKKYCLIYNDNGSYIFYK